MNLALVTPAAFSLAAFLDSAEVADATTAVGSRRSVRLEETVTRSYAGSPSWAFIGAEISSTAKANNVLLVGAERPEDKIVADVSEYLSLCIGWDGENAAKPGARAVLDAVRFIRSVGDSAVNLEPTLDVDGAVILELNDDAAFRFKGDGTIAFTSANGLPGKVAFDGYALPEVVRSLLAI